MKFINILVNKTIESKSTGWERCSNGLYKNQTINQSIRVYSNIENITLEIAEKVNKVIEYYTTSSCDRIWYDCEDSFSEKYSFELTKKVVDLFYEGDAILKKTPSKCPILLNPIIDNVISFHKTCLLELSNNQNQIKLKFQNDLLENKLEIASKALSTNESIYSLNKILPGFDEYPLDVAMKCNDKKMFDNFFNKNATKVRDKFEFTKWLCKIGRFECIETFIDVKLLIFKEFGTSYPFDLKEIYELSHCILYYTLLHNKIEYYEKFCNGKFVEKIGFDPIKNEISFSKISVAKFLLKNSSKDIIIHFLKCNYNFYEILVLSYSDGNNHYRNEKTVLIEECFSNEETFILFYNKYQIIEIVYGLLYWRKYELLNKLIIEYPSEIKKLHLSDFNYFKKRVDAEPYLSRINKLHYEIRSSKKK